MQHVRIRHKETQAEGTCPPDAVPFWLGKGYEVVDGSYVDPQAALTEADDSPADTTDEPDGSEDNGTAAVSAETTSSSTSTTPSARGGRRSN